MVPDWIAWAVPFVSGVGGVYVGLKVGITRLEANYVTLSDQVEDAKAKIAKQVGEDRCDKYRAECQGRIEKALDKLNDTLKDQGEKVTTKFERIAIYMAKHDGD